MQWTTIFKKEMTEYWRNFKWIWVPLVFILLAVMDPLSTYYLPQIIDAVGGMPEGAVMEIPEIPASAALMMSLSEFSLMGTALIALISMGLIAGERKSGVAELILVKPVGYFTYISSKWAATLILIWTAFLIGILASWYYVNLLFGEITFPELLQVIFFYGIWLALVVSVSVFFNTMFRTPGLVAFATIATLVILNVISAVFGHVLTWFPNHISTYLSVSLSEGGIPGELWGSALVTFVFIAALLVGSLFVLRKKEMAG